MKRVILAIFLSFIPLLASADKIDAIPDRIKMLSENLNHASVSFVQTKIMPESTKRFTSTGKIKFIKNVGVKWMQIKPTTKTFISTTDKYCSDDGVVQDLSDLPHFSYVKNTIDDMLNGDMTRFLYAFDVDYTESEKDTSWHMVSTPTISGISDLIQNITIYGTTTRISKIILTYHNGTILILEFTILKSEITDEIKC